jgi:glycosyltransferase involved in cell wall biosynthesis
MATERVYRKRRYRRVVHVSPLMFGVDGVVGGGERYAYELARAMSQLTPTRLVSFGKPLSRREDALRVAVYRPLGFVGRKRLGPISPGLIAEIAAADVVHVHQIETFLADQCVLLARLFGKRVFLTDHAGGDRHFNRRLGTVDRATGLLLVSEFNARGYTAWQDKLTVIHGGADPARFRQLAGVNRVRRALYAGRLIPYKGVHHLIEGARPETGIVVAGQSYHDEYRAFLDKVSIGRNVQFAGPLMGDDLVRAYNTASVSVAPSVEVDMYGKTYPKSEILGLVLLEAMACGTPVVASRIGGMMELVVDGETGIGVPPGDTEAVGEAVERILDDDDLARRMGRAGHARVMDRFTWAAVAKRCLSVYRREDD